MVNLQFPSSDAIPDLLIQINQFLLSKKIDLLDHEEEVRKLNLINEFEKRQYQMLSKKYDDLAEANELLLKQNLELQIENIAELKASKILLGAFKGAATHREKSHIANNAEIVLGADIQKKIESIAKLLKSKELPF